MGNLRESNSVEINVKYATKKVSINKKLSQSLILYISCIDNKKYNYISFSSKYKKQMIEMLRSCNETIKGKSHDKTIYLVIYPKIKGTDVSLVIPVISGLIASSGTGCGLKEITNEEDKIEYIERIKDSFGDIYDVVVIDSKVCKGKDNKNIIVVPNLFTIIFMLVLSIMIGTSLSLVWLIIV